jgi:hypothetical protein
MSPAYGQLWLVVVFLKLLDCIQGDMHACSCQRLALTFKTGLTDHPRSLLMALL